jgi:Ca-activated chloride channel family protein
MWKWACLICCACSCFPATAQYYLRGEIRDDRNRLLEGVRIRIQSRGSFPYYSGAGGSFGISLSTPIDTLQFQLDGYEALRMGADTRVFQHIRLKMLPSTANLYKRKLSSVTPHLQKEKTDPFAALGESYSTLEENGFVDAYRFPETGFALNINKASYSNIRRFLNNQMKVPVDAIRIEELLNYFPLPLQAKPTDTGFGLSAQITTCPWQENNRLLFLRAAAPKLSLEKVPPSRMVFLIDVSGSMDKPNRLPLLQAGFSMLIDQLRENDTIAVVTYGGVVGIALPPTGGNQKMKIRNVIDSLTASGDTPGEHAIHTAFELARRTFLPGGNNRVILATDGDFNVGASSEKELEDMISAYRQSGIYLTCLGVGMGNYKDSKLESLAKKGNGNFAYIDNLQEAQKVLVTELTQTLYAVADNASLHVHFAPDILKEYRLIGFDNKKNASEDSTAELEGGEIGSGHSILAIFEMTPAQTDSLLSTKHVADITLQYRVPGTEDKRMKQVSVPWQVIALDKADTAYRFAAAVSLFGSILRQSGYTRNYQLEDVLNMAQQCVTNNPLQKEFLSLIEKAIAVYHPGRKKKK